MLEWLRLRLLAPGTSLLELSEKVPARKVFSIPAPIPEDILEAMDTLCLRRGPLLKTVDMGPFELGPCRVHAPGTLYEW